MMKKFRKRISIKWILLPAVLAAAIVVPAAQADPWPFVQAENNASGGTLNHFLTGQVATVPVVDAHHQALLDKKQTPATPAGVIADGLRYQALAQHYATLSGSPSSNIGGLGGPGSTGPGVSTAGLQPGTSGTSAGVIADGLRYQALAKHYLLLAGLNADSQRYQALANHYEQLAGIKADGLRYTALAKKYAQPSTPQAIGSGTSFQWGDAATGFGVGIGLIVLMSVVGFAVVGTRNRTAPA